jgi:hypothetical protein
VIEYEFFKTGRIDVSDILNVNFGFLWEDGNGKNRRFKSPFQAYVW